MYQLYSIQINYYWFHSIANGCRVGGVVAASHFSLNLNKNFDQIYIYWLDWNTISSFASLLEAHGIQCATAIADEQVRPFDKLFYLLNETVFVNLIWFRAKETDASERARAKKEALAWKIIDHTESVHTLSTLPTMRAVCLAVRDHFIWPDWIMSVWNPWIQNKSNKAVNWNEYKIDLMTLLFPALFPIWTLFSNVCVCVCELVWRWNHSKRGTTWQKMSIEMR